jgi:hypothetical protein
MIHSCRADTPVRRLEVGPGGPTRRVIDLRRLLASGTYISKHRDVGHAMDVVGNNSERSFAPPGSRGGCPHIISALSPVRCCISQITANPMRFLGLR